MRFHSLDSPWKVLTPKVSASRGKVIAAVAYVGADAPAVLPLKKGDVLICDASPPTIASGATSVAALRKYLNDGIDVYSHPALHAKVVLLPRRLFVGSANASGNSRDELDEAVIETTDRDAIDQARQFANTLMQPYDLLSNDDLDTLSEIKVAKRTVGPRRAVTPTSVPLQVPRMWVVVMRTRSWTKTSGSVYAAERRRVSRHARRSGRVNVQAVEWITTEASQVCPDDWVVQIIAGRMYAPARVVKVSPSTSKYALVWLAAPSTGPRSVYVKDLAPRLQTIAKSKDLICWKGVKTRTICALFQPVAP